MLVWKKNYDELEEKYNKALRQLAELEQELIEEQEVVDWAIQMVESDLIIVRGTHIQNLLFTDDIAVMNGNDLVGRFSNVEFYVKYDEYNNEDNYLDVGGLWGDE